MRHFHGPIVLFCNSQPRPKDAGPNSLFDFTALCATLSLMLLAWRLSKQMTEIIMKKLATIALALGLSASTAFAGGYTAPVVEAEPVVVKSASSSTPAIVIPALLLVALAVAASDSSSDSSSSSTN